MAPDKNGLFCGKVLILLLYISHQTTCVPYELDSVRLNWTTAVLQYGSAHQSYLARISNLDKLCDAQTLLIDQTDSREYWTALSRTSDGQYQWGNGSTALIDPELLDTTQHGHCYAISISSIKLMSRDCNSLKGVLLTFDDDGNGESDSGLPYSDECIEYKMSNCLHVDTNNSQWKSLLYTWSCKIVSGISIGNCEVEVNSLDCCEKYCNPGNLSYSKDILPHLSVKVRKVPKGFSEEVVIGFNSGNEVKLASEVFNGTERIVVATLHRRREHDSSCSQDDNFTPNSDVIGVSLRPPYNQTFPNLVTITFSHAKILQGGVQRKCVFWKEEIWTSNGSWSSEGCSVLDASSFETTVCSCNHLTNFAVLMQFTSVKIPKEDEVSLSIITYTGCALSLTGEFLVVFIHVVFMKLKAEGIQIRINLALALFLAQLVFLSGINATSNKPACVLVAVLLHYFFLASFGWMLLEGVYLYVMIVEVFSTVHMRYLYLFAWGYPIVPVIISLVISAAERGVLQTYTNQNFCWLSFSKKLSWSFIVPVLLVTTINIVILLAVLREIRNLEEPNPSTLKSFKKGFKACIILSPLLGLTWVFGLLAVTDAGLVFQYIFTILNSSQGMLIFLLHVVRNSDVRAEIHHKLLKWRFERFFHISSANRVYGNNTKSSSKQNQEHGREKTGNEPNHTHTAKQDTINFETVL